VSKVCWERVIDTLIENRLAIPCLPAFSGTGVYYSFAHLCQLLVAFFLVITTLSGVQSGLSPSLSGGRVRKGNPLMSWAGEPALIGIFF
jgi:hypothetical protein